MRVAIYRYCWPTSFEVFGKYLASKQNKNNEQNQMSMAERSS